MMANIRPLVKSELNKMLKEKEKVEETLMRQTGPGTSNQPNTVRNGQRFNSNQPAAPRNRMARKF